VELNRAELPPQMLKPVADWDLPSLATALTATSLKAKLQSMQDLTQKFGPMFAASRHNTRRC